MVNIGMIKIGVAQIKNSIDLGENFKNIKKCLDIFKASDADLILFPECALSGFSAKIGECTLDLISPYLDEIKNWSIENKKMVILPTALNEENIYNTGFVFQENQVERFYKIGLTESEKKFFSVPDNYNKKVYKLKGYKFIPLICLEAQLDSELYFSHGEVDFILWPGYWGWEEKDKWEALKTDGEENLVYANSSKWSVPLIQSNFAYNDLGDGREKGPHGLSIVVDGKNKLAYRASFEQQECFLVELNKAEINRCYSLGSFE